MSEVIVTESSLEDIADAIRAKNGTQNTYTPSQMAAAIEALPTATIEPLSVTENGTYTAEQGKAYSPVTVDVQGSGDLDALIEGSLTSIESDATTIRDYAFYKYTQLTDVTLNGTVFIKGNAFNGCTALTNFDAKKAYRINGNAFSGVLSDLVFPNITGELGAYAVDSWKGEKFDVNGNNNLAIKLVAFNNATNFNTLILRRTTVVPLSGGTGAFNNTPFASGKSGGTLYVPQSLISSYQSASNWSTILGYANNQIKAIEGSIYETQYADGTPIS